MLDVLDKELETRGHRFVRYADDCNLYVRSRRAGERVMASVTDFLARRLKLTVNAAKSAVDRPSARAFLGFSFTAGPTPQRVVSPKALAPVQGAGSGTDASHDERPFRLSRGGAVPLPHWVAGLLRTLRGPLTSCSASTSGPDGGFAPSPGSTGNMEYPLLGAAPPRRRQAAGGPDRKQCPWPVADQPQPSALDRAAQRLLRPDRPSHPSPQAMPLNSVEPPCTEPYARVVWEGRSRDAPPYPDFATALRATRRSRRLRAGYGRTKSSGQWTHCLAPSNERCAGTKRCDGKQVRPRSAKPESLLRGKTLPAE